MDIKVDYSGNVVFEHGDLKTTDGVEEFEQRLALYLQEHHSEIIGDSLPPENAVAWMEVLARRVARRFDGVDRIVNFNATQVRPDAYELDIHYVCNGEYIQSHFPYEALQ